MFLLPKSAFAVQKTKKKGKGVFATKDIPPGTIIGDYIGTIIHPKDEDRYEKEHGLYLMYYHDRATIIPDLRSVGVHLLNNSCTPNCWLYTYKGHTLFFAIRKIFKGEELTISYMLGPQDQDCTPCDHACYCGSLFCTQTMHIPKEKFEKWVAFDDMQEKKTKHMRVKIGKKLAPLPSYPKKIPDHKLYTLFGAEKKKPLKLNKKTMPSIREIRKLIRETGRPLAFPKVKTTVLGVSENFLTTVPFSS